MTPTRVDNLSIGEVVFLSGSRRAVVIFLHPNEGAVTIQHSNGGRREKIPVWKILKKKNCCGG